MAENTYEEMESEFRREFGRGFTPREVDISAGHVLMFRTTQLSEGLEDAARFCILMGLPTPVSDLLSPGGGDLP